MPLPLRLSTAHLAAQANCALGWPTPVPTVMALINELDAVRADAALLDLEAENKGFLVEHLEASNTLLVAECRDQIERAARAEAFATALCRLLLLMVKGEMAFDAAGGIP